METIPLIESAEDAQAGAAPALPEASSAAHEPLAVETLEDRVLLATDTAPAAPNAAPPAEPASYLAAEHTPRLAINLESVVDMAGTNADAQPSLGASAGQPSARQPAHGEAEFVESKLEAFEKPAPDNDSFHEPESNRNEFGLATIEPETSASDIIKSSHDRGSFHRLVVEASEPVDSEAAATPRGDASEMEMGPLALEVAVQEVADELDTALVKTAGTGSRIEPATADGSIGTAAEALSSREQSEVLAQTVLKTEPVAPAVTAHEVDPSAGEAEFGTQEGNLQESLNGARSDADVGRSNVQPQQQRPLHDMPADAASAAHDALFEGGGGVEVVLAPPTNP